MILTRSAADDEAGAESVRHRRSSTTIVTAYMATITAGMTVKRCVGNRYHAAVTSSGMPTERAGADERGASQRAAHPRGAAGAEELRVGLRRLADAAAPLTCSVQLPRQTPQRRYCYICSSVLRIEQFSVALPFAPTAMSLSDPVALTRRERQLMDILYRLEQATVAEVMAELDDEVSYSTVRALLGRLVTKGAARYAVDGPRYVYAPARPITRERVSALRHVVNTFFGGSRVDAVAALFDKQSSALSDDELARLAKLVQDARKRGG